LANAASHPTTRTSRWIVGCLASGQCSVLRSAAGATACEQPRFRKEDFDYAAFAQPVDSTRNRMFSSGASDMEAHSAHALDALIRELQELDEDFVPLALRSLGWYWAGHASLTTQRA